MPIKSNIAHSIATGISGGAVSYGLFPERAFAKPAMHMAAAAFATNLIMPFGSTLGRSALTGAFMGAQCLWLTGDCPPEGALRYALLCGVCAYVGEQLIVPYVMRGETMVENKLGKL